MVFTIVSIESNFSAVFLKKVRKRKTAVRRRPARNVDIPNTSDIFGIDPTTNSRTILSEREREIFYQ